MDSFPWTALALAYAGMCALCLALERHHKQVWGREPGAGARRALRCAGWLLLALAGWPGLAGRGAGVGLALWCGVLSLGALLAAMLLPYAPRLLPRSAALAGAVGLLALLRSGVAIIFVAEGSSINNLMF